MDEFKVGMKVVHSNRHSIKTITEVVAITPKGFVKIANGTLFKPNGWERTSDPWSHSQIWPATESDFEMAERSAIIQRIKGFLWWRKLNTKTLKEIDSIIQKVEDQIKSEEAAK